MPGKIKLLSLPATFEICFGESEARQFLVGTTKPILLFTRLSPSAEVKRPQRQPFRLFATTNTNFFQFKSSIYINVLLAEIVAAWKSVSIAMHDIKRYKKSMLFEKLKYTLRLLQISGKTGSQNNPASGGLSKNRKSAFAVFVVL